ncbi:hypothetical protein J8F10_10075 [Gemmata sp. G18]|uniref:Uncharacterized protein n=1 Tax=Gemmata palustris TaxID=2822762 RepID=A0ABS5BPH0_9BACT|nr:hypothetical protein [Gemmata palustris]MBP3955627.1 hypothetical protein [Gemmata palustris]
MATVTQPGLRPSENTTEAEKHSEGPVARKIEQYTAQVPSDVFLWAAGGSIVASLALRVLGRKEDAQFVGQWVAPFMLLGVYNKIVKVAGSDRVHAS